MKRELSDADVRVQAEALRDYVSRGGAASLWLTSKGLLSGDRAAVLLALSDMDDGSKEGVEMPTFECSKCNESYPLEQRHLTLDDVALCDDCHAEAVEEARLEGMEL